MFDLVESNFARLDNTDILAWLVQIFFEDGNGSRVRDGSHCFGSLGHQTKTWIHE